MITIAFNDEEQGQANEENEINQENEELENINTATDKIMSEDQKERLNEKKDKVKKLAENKKVRSFIIAHLVPILIVIGIILLILILIGQYAFFTTMPGMLLEKVKEFALSVWGEFKGFFTGDNVTTSVSKEDVLNLAQYLQNMGYDIESCGLGNAEYEESSEEDKNKTKQLKSIGESVDGKEYLKAYIASNEATYVLSTWSLNGFLKEEGSKLLAFVKADPSQIVNNEEISTGMINILDTSSVAPSERFVKIDRQNEKMTVYTNAIYLPIIGAITDILGLTDNGSIQWGSTFSYDMSTWTAKYGKPVELFLSVHLSTMMPDLAYRIAKDQELNTKVNIVLQDINVKYDTSVKTIGGNASDLTEDEIVNAFLNYGLSGQNCEYTDEEDDDSDSDENEDEENEEDNDDTEKEKKNINFYNEILNSLTSQEEKNQFFRNIIEQVQNNWISDVFGINIANAMINDDEGNAISRFLKRISNDIFSLAERLLTGDSKYILYVKKGNEAVPGLEGITYDDLFELADIVGQGQEEGIDGVKWPYIQSVTNHWYYNDIDFSVGVYRKASTAKKKIKYESADEENSSLSKHNIEVELDATLTADEGIVYQVCEPEATGPNQHIIDIFKDKYYKYDGTVETAKKIDNAKLYDKNGAVGSVEDKTIEKEEVSFEDNKANALAAFSILENMHSEEAEFVYRNLKDLVVNLEYFTKDELSSDLKNAMMWIIKTDNKNEDFTVTKDANEYGMVIKNVDEREVVAPENCEISEEGGVATLKFTKMSDATIELLKYIYEDDYKNINPDILVGLTMKIKGIDHIKTGSAERGEVIGTATGDINVIMFDIDKSIIDDIEEYMVPKHNNTYEDIMRKKKNQSYEQGIDIGKALEEDGIFSNNGGENSAIITGQGTWSYNDSDFDVLCAITRAEAGDNPREFINVITTACNRADVKMHGLSDPLSHYKRDGDFVVYGTKDEGNYGNGIYKKYLNRKLW